MRRFVIAVAALALALSPVAFNASGGARPARADLGWCDTCSVVATPPAHHHHR